MKHILSITEPQKFWCGETFNLTSGVPPFRTLDQVSFNGLFPSESNKPICKDCVTLCVQSLLNNIEADND